METKEQQECLYCHDKTVEFGDMGGFKIIKQPFMHWFSLISLNVYSDRNEMIDDSEIKFCPMCGRKLVPND